jgi:hypothetical protein
MTDLATAYANAGKALLDLADAIVENQPPGYFPEPGDAEPPFVDTPAGRSEAGGCPVHSLPWVIRPAGTSKKTGEPYRAFWHCNEQNADGSFCREKPSPAWVKAHPIK